MLCTIALLQQAADGFLTDAHGHLDQAQTLDALAADIEARAPLLITGAAMARMNRDRAEHHRTQAARLSMLAQACLLGMRAVKREAASRRGRAAA